MKAPQFWCALAAYLFVNSDADPIVLRTLGMVCLSLGVIAAFWMAVEGEK